MMEGVAQIGLFQPHCRHPRRNNQITPFIWRVLSSSADVDNLQRCDYRRPDPNDIAANSQHCCRRSGRSITKTDAECWYQSQSSSVGRYQSSISFRSDWWRSHHSLKAKYLALSIKLDFLEPLFRSWPIWSRTSWVTTNDDRVTDS